MTGTSTRAALEAHALACREALAAIRPRPEIPANLRSADLSGAELRYANLRDANLSSVNLSGAELRYANLRGAELRYANLRDANLSGVNLSGAELRYANLRGAELRYANLRDANLSGADLRDADLIDANLSGAELPDSYRIASLCFGGWAVTVTDTHTTIGCQTHPNADWLRWQPSDVAHMHEEADAWWTRHRKSVRAVIRDVMQAIAAAESTQGA